MPTDNRSILKKANAQLIDKLMKWLPANGDYQAPVEGLAAYRRDWPHRHENNFYQPQIIFVLQGRKKSIIGSEEYVYGPHTCLIVGLDMPSFSHVFDVSPETPFLSVTLRLDKKLVAQLSAESSRLDDTSKTPRKGIALCPADGHTLEAFQRLAELSDHGSQIPVLAPLVIREIHYRLLEGPMGDHIRAFSLDGNQSCQISQAVSWLRSNYRANLKVEDLARMVNMGTSTFHRHFKQVTSLSPLQYQKKLRLYEAQRLMLTDNQDAVRAALAVGYESPTQFNREYKRLFGEPPLRNINRLHSLHHELAENTI